MHILILAALALGQQAPAPASPPARPGAATGQPVATIVAEPAGMLIAACDADGDGRVTRVELTACIARSFAAADTAHKGALGYIDYSDWALKWLGDRNALPSPYTLDNDGDDKITLTELQAQFATLFTRFDTDKDGVVTRAELLTIRSATGGGLPEGKRKRR